MLNITECQKIEDGLKQLVDTNKLPGYCMAIINDNEVYKSDYGYQQLLPEKIKVSEKTIYDMASLSKLISTATCILKLMEEGLIALENKVADYLEVYEKEITIKDCLTHTTGFDDSDIADYKNYSDKQFIDALMNMKSHPDLKGTVKYSDTNFIYLGFIVERLKGGLDTYANEVIFTPLGMKDTCYNPLDKSRCAATELTEKRGVIKGTVHDGKGYRLNGVSGSSGLFSTIDDTITFVKMIMDDNNPFLNKESRSLLKTVLADTKTGRRSVGWCISDPTMEAMGTNYSEHTLYHTGFTGGSIFIDLDNNLALIVLCNRIHPSRDNRAIMDIRPKLHNEVYKCIKA